MHTNSNFATNVTKLEFKKRLDSQDLTFAKYIPKFEIFLEDEKNDNSESGLIEVEALANNSILKHFFQIKDENDRLHILTKLQELASNGIKIDSDDDQKGFSSEINSCLNLL